MNKNGIEIQSYFNKCMLYNFVKNLKARCGHSAVVIKQGILIFGGIEEIMHEVNDLWLLDIQAKTLQNIFRKQLEENSVKSNINEFYKTSPIYSEKLIQQKSYQFSHSISPSKSPARLKPLKSLPYQNQISLNIVKGNTEGMSFHSKSINSLAQMIQPSKQFKIKTFTDYIKLKEALYMTQNTEQSLNKTRYQSLDKSSTTMCGFWKKSRFPIIEPVPPPKSFLGTDKERYQSKKKNIKSDSEQTRKLVQQVKKEMMLSGVNDLESLSKPEVVEHSPLTQTMQDVIGDLNDGIHNLQPQRLTKQYFKEFGIQIINHRIKGEKACARDGHTAVLSKNMMIIFGGDRNKNSLSSLHLLDLEKLFP